MTTAVRVLHDPRAADWLTRRLASTDGRAAPGRRVDHLLPAGFARYLRVLHPVPDGAGTLTWADVAARRGRTMHALTGWADLASPGAVEPPVGTLPVEQLAALCDVLAQHTGTADDCTFALWPGRPGWAATGATAGPTGGWSSPDDPTLVRFAGRDHVLVAGSLSDAIPLSFSDEPGRWWEQSPTVAWPADRAWCITTDPGRRCTLVGGTVALAEDLLAAADLEVWPVAARDVLPDEGPLP